MKIFKMFFFAVLCTSSLPAEEVLVNTKGIYPYKYVYIIQTEKDSSKLKNPFYAIKTDLYAGLKKGLWINVVGFGNTPDDLTIYKSKYPQGYLKKLGQFRKISSSFKDSIPFISGEWLVEYNGYFLSDTQFIDGTNVNHYLLVWDIKGKLINSDTFAISTESQVTHIYLRLLHSRAAPLIIERHYQSPLTGTASNIRIFNNVNENWCLEETVTNDGGLNDPINALYFDPETDQPGIQEILKDKVVSQKKLTCKK